MKKYIISVSVALFALAMVTSAQNYIFNNDLSVGATGQDVVNLQTWLISNGFNIPSISNGATYKGYFGTQTKAAVMAYQNSVGLPAFGYFGPLTRGRVNGGNTNNASVLRVTSPNGGESWPLGTVQNITWSPAPDLPPPNTSATNAGATNLPRTVDIKLEYPLPACAQPGQIVRCMIMVRAPYTLAQNVPLNSGSYSWTVGHYILPPGQIATPDCYNGNTNPCYSSASFADPGQYKIQICPTDGSQCAESNSNFNITSSVVTNAGPLQVTSPVGGEQWLRGSTQNITWTSPYYVRATYADIKLIQPSPGVGVLRPNCGPSYCQGTNSGPFTIASSIGINQNSYPWHVGYDNSYATCELGVNNGTNCPMNVPDGQYYVQICEVNSTDCATSQGSVTIYSGTTNSQSPVIHGIDGPTTLSVGQTGTWIIRASDPNNASLSYYIDWGDTPTTALPPPQSGNSATTMPQQIQRTSTFTYAYSLPGTYTVRVTVTNSTGLTAQTSTTVYVSGITNPVSPITITSPVGGEYWPANSTRQITWNFANPSYNSKVDLYLVSAYLCPPPPPTLNYVCPAVITLDKNIAYNATYNWIVGTDIVNNTITPANYYMRVCVAGTNTCTTGTNTFRITPSVNYSQPGIHITSPMPNTIWRIGISEPITWNSSGIDPSAIGRIELTGGPYNTTYTMAYGVPNTGSYQLQFGQFMGGASKNGVYSLGIIFGNYSDIVGPITLTDQLGL